MESVENETSNERSSRSGHRYALLCVFFIGRCILLGIWTYLLVLVVVTGVKYYHAFMGFVALHLVLECSVVHSDPIWDHRLSLDVRSIVHVFLAVLTITATAASLLPGLALAEYRKDSGKWGHLFIGIIEMGLLFINVFTGTALTKLAEPKKLYALHKCSGTFATYFMIVVLVSGIFGILLDRTIEWIVIVLTVCAYLMMPFGFGGLARRHVEVNRRAT